MAIDIDVLLSEGTQAARAAVKELARLAEILEDFPQICERAAKQLEPFVRQELNVSYEATGLAKEGNFIPKAGDKKGLLYQAWVTNSVIKANQLGILVYLQPGLGNDNPVYKRAGVFQHGGVWGVAGSGDKSKSFRIRAKSGLKKNTIIGGGVRVVAPRPIKFDARQMDKLATKYVQLVQAEIDGKNNG